jgi:hypothetical protein
MILLGSNVARRVEWRGRGLPADLRDHSTFRDGFKALPNDTITLAVLVASWPLGFVMALLYESAWSWAGVGLSSFIALAALARLIVLLRRRQ